MFCRDPHLTLMFSDLLQKDLFNPFTTKAAGRKWPIFPRAAKSGHEKRVQKNALYTLGKAVFVNTYCSIVMGRHKPIKSQEVRIQNYCMRRVVKGRSLASLQDVRA